MRLHKTVPAAWVKSCKVGDSIICAGHNSYAKAPLIRAGFKFTSHQAWLVLMTTNAPEPVTVITVTEFPED